jgi:protein-S-isoprenylcysteine O-methyltransferase Ste14
MVTNRLPSLGNRGEGWVIGQFVLIWLVIALGVQEHALVWPFDAVRSATLVVGALALIVGLGVVALAIRDLGRQITPWPRPSERGHLVSAGVYGVVRHPIYAGIILAALGGAVLAGSPLSLLAAVGLAIWLDLKARREEAWLVDRYPEYATYRARSRRFVPGIY